MIEEPEERMIQATATCPAPAELPAAEPPAVEDARWVRAARAGDEDGLLRLVGRYRPPLVRLLTGLTGDLATAEDLAQDTFLQAFRKLGGLREPERFYPWVRRLAFRQALRLLKGRREIPSAILPDPGSAADPATAAELRMAVQAVLARLPPDFRAVLVLREMEQLDYAEIAEALEVPVGTVRSRLFAARERFRAHWQVESSGAEG